MEEAAIWWKRNRTKAPYAFAVDLENALKLIASHPDIGVRAVNISLEGVEVLAFWHTSRADSPNI